MTPSTGWFEQRTLRASGLEFGALHTGSEADPLVICLHGFPDAPTTFCHQVGALVEAGYRVVAPTLRGYEPSSQPADRDYSLMTLAADVVGWLDDLDVDRAHLVGHDWGAAIAYVAGAHHPDRLLTVTAMAVPPIARIPEAVRRVPRQLLRSWYMTFFQLPVISDRALQARNWDTPRRAFRCRSLPAPRATRDGQRVDPRSPADIASVSVPAARW